MNFFYESTHSNFLSQQIAHDIVTFIYNTLTATFFFIILLKFGARYYLKSRQVQNSGVEISNEI